MKARTAALAFAAMALPISLVGAIPAASATARPAARGGRQAGRYILRAKSAADLAALKGDLASGIKVEDDLGQIDAVAVDVSGANAGTRWRPTATWRRSASPPRVSSSSPTAASSTRSRSPLPAQGRQGRPGLVAPGPDVEPRPDRGAAGQPHHVWQRPVTVGVADTGLDFTHSELAGRIAGQADLTDPTLCPTTSSAPATPTWPQTFGGPGEHRLERPRLVDRRQHRGSLDSVGINGIAPKVKPLRAEDLRVVRVRVRLVDPRRVPVRGRPRHRRRAASRSAATSTAAILIRKPSTSRTSTP